MASDLDYIKRYWKRTECFCPKDSGVLIGVPNPFISPNHKIYKDDIYYWDSYFQNLGLIESGKIELAKGIVDNFAYLHMRFGFIPARNRYYETGQSQPPFLTSMILDIYEVTKDKEWLRKMTRIAEDELKNYWMAKIYHAKKGHMVYEGMSRYLEHFYTHVTAEHESGWDLTSRYKHNCLDYLPVDLNSLLYKYETDLKRIYSLFGNSAKVRKYTRMASNRKKTMIKLMWAEKRGFFFDYNYRMKRRSKFYSLAGYFPMWVGIATEKQAKRMVRNLRKFEYRGRAGKHAKGGTFKGFQAMGLSQWLAKSAMDCDTEPFEVWL